MMVGVPRDLPPGTVTFLFTDVEGSTRLLHELGTDRYADVLAEHRRILRETFSAHGGVEVDTQGDAFFVAFPTAPEAVRAAAQVVEELSSGPIQVRIGMHTGTPHVGENTRASTTRRNHKKGLTPRSVHTWYRKLAEAGLVEGKRDEGGWRGLNMHRGRHTVATDILRKTGNIVAAQRLLGHKDVSTTVHAYAQFDDADLARVLEAMREET